MNARQHAYLACALQDACGGVDACLDLLEDTPFKMGRTHIYDCRDAGNGRTMPIGAIVLLEEKAGQRIYTSAAALAAPAPSDAACALNEAAEATEGMADAQRAVRLAGADGVYTETERRAIEPKLQAVERRVRRVRRAMEGAAAA